MFFNIQRWSLHDGPGIRTTVFFKGCPLRCRWCSNPESWSFRKQLIFLKDRCRGCGRCIQVCPAGVNILKDSNLEYDCRECLQCGRCAEVCPENARELIGRDLPASEIVGILEKDAVFYRSSSGGVTFSGGEPFAQLDMLRELAKGCALTGIPTAVETSGYFFFDEAVDIIELIDDVFIDLKHTNDRVHRKLTGVSNQGIIENIFRLDAMGHAFIVRIPLIRDVNTDPENIDGVIGLCTRLNNLKGIELLPYHSLGVGKYTGLDLPYDLTLAAPDSETIHMILGKLNHHQLKASCSSLPGGPLGSDPHESDQLD